jgi:putative inorganic carbon (HCO3(-)) transporter
MSKVMIGLAVIYSVVLSFSLYNENYYTAAFPLVILLGWVIIKYPGYILLAVSFFTPFSLNIAEFYDLPVGLNIPSEPMLIALMLLFVFLLMGGFSLFNIRLDHPILKLVMLQILWMLICIIFSEIPLVSLKYVIARLWFVLPCLFFAVNVFYNLKVFYSFATLFIFSSCMVVIYTIVRHSTYGFDKDSAHWVMEPLFRDHTVYGAVLALILPVNLGMLFIRSLKPATRFFLRMSTLILVLGIIFSYTRAAWISLAVGLVIFLVIYFRMNLRLIVFSTLIASCGIIISWDNILMSMEKNKQESSDKLEEHIGSISNVSSDASNLERINRWNCAWQMFLEKPLTGWGPGTYQFVYAPFQLAKDRTIISTNQGDGGNAHSEYLGPLCEQGVLGFLGVIFLVILTSFTALRLYNSLLDRDTRIIMISCYIGLVTYFTHGVLNNYLDSDKASVPFWGFLAVIISADLYAAKKGEVKTVV